MSGGPRPLEGALVVGLCGSVGTAFVDIAGVHGRHLPNLLMFVIAVALLLLWSFFAWPEIGPRRALTEVSRKLASRRRAPGQL